MAHSAAQTYDLYGVFHMVLGLNYNWKQKYLINVDVLLTFSDRNKCSPPQSLTEIVLITICPSLLIWVKDAELLSYFMI